MLRQGAGATCSGWGECLDPVPVQPASAEGLQWLTPVTVAVPGFPAAMLCLPQLAAGCFSGLPPTRRLVCHLAAHHPDMHCYLHVLTQTHLLHQRSPSHAAAVDASWT